MSLGFYLTTLFDVSKGCMYTHKHVSTHSRGAETAAPDGGQGVNWFEEELSGSDAGKQERRG